MTGWEHTRREERRGWVLALQAGLWNRWWDLVEYMRSPYRAFVTGLILGLLLTPIAVTWVQT